MRDKKRVPWFGEDNRVKYLAAAAASVVGIAIADWFIIPDVGFGFLYFFPIILASAFLSRWQIVSLALVCSALRDLYLPAALEKWPRMIAVFAIYVCVGLLVREMVIYRRAAQRHLQDLESEIKRCQRSERELQVLINSSPVGILTVSPTGNIVLSNAAAHRVFGVSPGALSGKAVGSYVPELQQLCQADGLQKNGTALECRCRREDGGSFLARIWLSSSNGASGTLFTAVIVDAPR